MKETRCDHDSYEDDHTFFSRHDQKLTSVLHRDLLEVVAFHIKTTSPHVSTVQWLLLDILF